MKFPNIDPLRWQHLLKKFQRQKRLKKKQHSDVFVLGGTHLKPVDKKTALVIRKRPEGSKSGSRRKAD